MLELRGRYALSTLVFAVFAAAFCIARSLAAETVLFEQPRLNEVDENFHVPLAEHKYPDKQPFNLILWQPNPGQPDGKLVPSRWRAGDFTGLYPSAPVEQHQLAFRDAPGASTVQADGDAVGALVDSSDLPAGSPGEKMMITPAVKWSNEKQVRPFLHKNLAIVTSLDLQVPTAQDSNRPGNFTYVTAYLVLEDQKSHSQISYGITLFHHGLGKQAFPSRQRLAESEYQGYDQPSHSFGIGNPLSAGSRVVVPLSGTALFQTLPWRGWKRYSFAITDQNFKVALRDLAEQQTGFTGSLDPSDYALIEWHLNAEIKFGSAPAKLGWSMRRVRLESVSIGDLAPLDAH